MLTGNDVFIFAPCDIKEHLRIWNTKPKKPDSIPPPVLKAYAPELLCLKLRSSKAVITHVSSEKLPRYVLFTKSLGKPK